MPTAKMQYLRGLNLRGGGGARSARNMSKKRKTRVGQTGPESEVGGAVPESEGRAPETWLLEAELLNDAEARCVVGSRTRFTRSVRNAGLFDERWNPKDSHGRRVPWADEVRKCLASFVSQHHAD